MKTLRLPSVNARVTVALTALAVACGGASGSDDLFTGATFSGGGEGDGGGGIVDGAGPNGIDTGTGTTGMDSGSGGHGGKDGGTGHGDAAPPMKDASTGDTGSMPQDASNDAQPLPDGSPPLDPGIYCGQLGNMDAFCAAGTQECCVSQGAAIPTYECKVANTSCQGNTPVTCDDGADCPVPGEVCCGTFSSSGYKSVRCMGFCTGTLGGDTLYRFCDPNAATDECAAIGKQCKPSAGLVGYSRCE